MWLIFQNELHSWLFSNVISSEELPLTTLFKMPFPPLPPPITHYLFFHSAILVFTALTMHYLLYNGCCFACLFLPQEQWLHEGRYFVCHVSLIPPVPSTQQVPHTKQNENKSQIISAMLRASLKIRCWISVQVGD